MCGIAGILGASDGSSVSTMVEALRHRGPDGAGVWAGDGCSLGHVRLSILDPSPAGAQPMFLVRHEGGRLVAAPFEADSVPDSDTIEAVLVFNGEIYNKDELSSELVEAGVEFVGESDTEVLLHHLFRFGEAALPRLAGMFALALWLPRAKQGLLAVDRFGIKPLYYTDVIEGRLAFSSEMRALRGLLGPVSADANALREFFMWGSVSGPATLTAGVSRLVGGELLRWTEEREEVSRWHTARGRGAPKVKGTTEDLRSALLESVGRHLISDVPLCLFLSGGIDSTVLLALAREELGRDAEIHTFSIGFEDPTFDESGLAARTAEAFGSVHHEWRFGEAEARACFVEYLNALDQPTIDGFNTWCVSKFVSEAGFKVALSGVGGDEFFGGYKSFQQVPQLLWLHRRFSWALARPISVLDRLSPSPRWQRLAAFLAAEGTAMSAYHALRGTMDVQTAGRMAEQVTGESLEPWRWSGDASGKPLGPAEISELEISRYMANQLLTDSDVFSMSHGIELRVPFVDTRLADVVSALPDRERFASGKAALLRAVPEVPRWVYEQPKRGFRFPFDQWVDEMIASAPVGPLQRPEQTLSAWYQKWAYFLACRYVDSGAAATS